MHMLRNRYHCAPAQLHAWSSREDLPHSACSVRQCVPGHACRADTGSTARGSGSGNELVVALTETLQCQACNTHTKTARTCSTPTPRCVVCDFQHHHVFALCVPRYFGQRDHHVSRVGCGRRRGVFHSPAGGVSVLLICEDGAAGSSARCRAPPSVPAYIVAAYRCWAVPERKA